MRPWRNADRPRVADVVVNRFRRRIEIVVEHLHARVAAVADIYQALGVNRDRVRRIELTGGAAPAADVSDESAALVVLHDARVHVAVGDEDVALRIPSDIGLAPEAV